MPSTREEGDTLIVPVVEEQLVVSKRLVLKEEIHIRRERTQSRVSQSVPIEREHATVERLDEKGNVIAVSRPPTRGR
jgi:stress response protein YsnF